eukprot:360652-Chlamydomonas_euryale.AAC.1
MARPAASTLTAGVSAMTSASAEDAEGRGLLQLGVSEGDLECPICVETVQDAFVTPCGHTFCHSCLTTHLRSRRNCPSCGTFITPEHAYPNFLLNKVHARRVFMYVEWGSHASMHVCMHAWMHARLQRLVHSHACMKLYAVGVSVGVEAATVCGCVAADTTAEQTPEKCMHKLFCHVHVCLTAMLGMHACMP